MSNSNIRQQLTDLREERAALQTQMRAILDKAEAEGRDLTRQEASQFDAAERQYDATAAEIKTLEPHGAASRSVPHLRDTVGRSVGKSPVLKREQRMTDWAATRSKGGEFTVDDAGDFCIGNIMRAMVEPDFRSELSEVERRALSEGTDSAGGFWTPEPLSASIIDKVRNVGQVFAAGATTVPLDSDKQSIPRLTGDPSGSWRNENGSFANSNATFDRVTFTPQSYGFIVQTSEELYQDMVSGGASVIENAIVQTAALELDRAALRGSGTAPEPRGIRNQSGVTLQSLGANGATPTNANLMTAVSTLLNANRQPDGIVYSPRSSQTFAGMVDTTGQPLRQPQPIADLPKYITSQIPNNLTVGTNPDTSEIYVGQWADLLVGIRLGIQLRLLTERYADNGQYAWRVFLRADVQLAHPESFVVVTGVRP